MPNLAAKSDCTGCSACVSICPLKCLQMGVDEEGFYYPELKKNNECINCHKCENICPIIHEKAIARQEVTVYAAYSKNESIRMASSSGGIFTEIAKQILKSQGYIYGAEYDEQFRVHHVCAKVESDLKKLQGAKYSQSDLENSFCEIKDYLENDKIILFVGMPCQVAGLKAFLQIDYPKLFTIDFVCHGVPSPMVWKSYVQYRAKIDNEGSLAHRINMRSKESGWSRYAYSTLFEYKEGTRFICRNSDNSFMKLFVNDYINRKSCSHCSYKGYNRISDITLGDFWGIWDIEPDMDDDKGTSVVLIHSKKGQQLWNSISDRLVVKEVSLPNSSAHNPSLLLSMPAKDQRVKVLQKCKKCSFEELDERYFGEKKESILASKIVPKIKNILKKSVIRNHNK